MSERIFRLILGAMILAAFTVALLIESRIPVYIVLGILAFEAITNWRIPIIFTRLRYGADYKHYLTITEPNSRMMSNFEAERMLRVAVFILLFLPYVVTVEYLNFLPWFLATALILAGATNICPMVMFLKSTGMR